MEEIIMKKPTGIIRRMDELGRIVIPKEIQRQLRVKAGSPFEIFPTEGGLYLQPYVSEDIDAIYNDLISRLENKASYAENPTEIHRLIGFIKENKNEFDRAKYLNDFFERSAG